MEKKTSFPSLRRFNLFMGGSHLIQGGLMVYLFLTVDKIQRVQAADAVQLSFL